MNTLGLSVGTAVCAALVYGSNAAAVMQADPTNADWHRVATALDRNRLRGWRDAWIAALAKARTAGEGSAIAAQGVLFDPDRALDGATPPPGRYQCRVFKIGSNGTAMRDFTAYPPVACQIDDQGAVSSLYKVSGAQRPFGLVFHDSATRSVFLGTMVLGDEGKPLTYGRDSGRDMAGYIERVGDRRWRLVLPYPRFESLLDVVEMVPAETPTTR